MSERNCALLLLCCVAGALGAGEFSVNVRTTSNQCNPAVATSADGGFVVVWSSYYGSSGRSNDIIARWFDPAGEPRTDEFRVNAARDGNQTRPAVGTHVDGHALVVWEGPGADEQEDIFARVLDANGVALTEEIGINTATQGRQMNPNVSSGRSGTFLVVWESAEPEGDGQRTAINGRWLAGDGTPQGPEFAIDSGQWDCRYPDAATDAAGNGVVLWLRDRSTKAIVLRTFDPNGIATSEPVEVNTDGISSLTCPAIAMSPTGDFVVTWDGDPDRASEDQIHARLFDPNAVPKTEPFLVSATDLRPAQWPKVAVNDANAFVIVWQYDSDDPNLASEVYARRFDETGTPMEPPFVLSDTGLAKQRYPDVAMTPNGAVVAVWESNQQPGSDYDVYARAEPVLFTSDFTGDGVVDFFDFRVLGWAWKAPADGNGTSYDIPELRTFSDQWLE